MLGILIFGTIPCNINQLEQGIELDLQSSPLNPVACQMDSDHILFEADIVHQNKIRQTWFTGLSSVLSASFDTRVRENS